MRVGSPEDLYRLVCSGKLALEMLQEAKGTMRVPDFENACKGIANGVARDLAAWITVHRPKPPEPKDTKEGRVSAQRGPLLGDPSGWFKP